jgi:hypothetical protein
VTDALENTVVFGFKLHAVPAFPLSGRDFPAVTAQLPVAGRDLGNQTASGSVFR